MSDASSHSPRSPAHAARADGHADVTDQAETRLTHAGRAPKSAHGAVNPAVVRASTLLFPDTAALRAAQGSRRTYGRHGTDTTRALEDALCAAEGAEDCLLTPSGLAAVTTTLLSLLKPGDDLLVTDTVYEPTRLFCDGMLADLGIRTRYYDPLEDVAPLWRPETRVLFAESPGSLSFEMQDIPALAALAHHHGAALVCDATWATPIGWQPFALGVDICIHAATKYIVGHSDVLMGAVTSRSPWCDTLRRGYRALGMSVSGDDAYLALRGLRTLAARLASHSRHALAVARWLAQRPEVAEVLYPPLEGAAGHDLWRRDFHPERACGLLGIVFKDTVRADQVDRWVDATRLFGIGYSWGGFESLILSTHPGDHRQVSGARWRGRPMARLHIGLEHPDDLIADLDQAFAAMGTAGA